MRNVIYAINLTADGCCDHTKGIADDETHDYYTRLLRDVDLMVFGRKTYQLMVPYWPNVARNPTNIKATDEFAQAFVSINQVVFSRTLDSAEGNARVVRTSLEDEIRRLKREPGKSILVGGVSVPSQLVDLGLVDEFHFVIHPVVAGEGRRLWDRVSLQESWRLKLVESKVFRSGCVALHYLRR